MTDYAASLPELAADDPLSPQQFAALSHAYTLMEADDALYAVDTETGDVAALGAVTAGDGSVRPAITAVYEDRFSPLSREASAQLAAQPELERAVAAVNTVVDDAALRYVPVGDDVDPDSIGFATQRAPYEALGGPGTTDGGLPGAPEQYGFGNPWPE